MNTYEVDVGGKTYDVDAPDPNTAWKWANQFHQKAEGERQARVRADQAATKAAFDKSESERPWGERAMINLGAGFDTAWQGAKQLAAKAGIGEGVSDEALQESRQRKADLAEGTTGGGLLQLAGEVAPTAVVPVGASGSLLKAAVMGGLGGAAAGALQPVLSDESRLANMALSGAGGAIAPVAVRGVQKALPRALGGSGEAATSTRAGKRLVEAVGQQDAGPVASRLEAPNLSQITGDIPLTAAEKAGSPRLARMELAHRKYMPDEFGMLAQRQNEAAFEAATKRAGIEGTDQFLNIAKNARDIATDPMRDEALQLAGRWSHVGEPLQRDAAALRSRTAAGSPGRALADLVDRNLAENPSPTQLYELRKLLAKKLSGPMVPGDDVAATVKGAERETMQMINAIDARLDEAAWTKAGGGTKFTDYMKQYSAMSPKVSSSRAQQQITDTLSEIGRPLVGDAPETTRHVLKQALKKHGTTGQGFERLTPEAKGRYEELINFLAEKEQPMRAVKLGGTGGGGSQTAVQNAAVLTGHALSPKLRIVNLALERLEGPVREEVAQMMLDPARAAAGIRAAMAAGQPLSSGQQAFLSVSRATGAALPAALFSQQAAGQR